MTTKLSLILLLIGCISTNKIYGQTHKTSLPSTTVIPDTRTIPENTSIEITIITLDSTSVALYNIIHFYLDSKKNKGIVLVKKPNHDAFVTGQKIKTKLCDIMEYRDIYRESDTTSIGKVPLIYGKQDGFKDKVDTLSYRGHFMLYGKIMNDGKLILDFADNADEPVFVFCKK